VVDSRKYGRPTVIASNPRMRSVGLPPIGFHEVLGRRQRQRAYQEQGRMQQHLAFALQ